MSLLLLVGAGLFLRTFRNLQHQDYGFESSHLLIAEFNRQLAGYKPSQTPGLHQQLLARLSALPGVRSVASRGSLARQLRQVDFQHHHRRLHCRAEGKHGLDTQSRLRPILRDHRNRHRSGTRLQRLRHPDESEGCRDQPDSRAALLSQRRCARPVSIDRHRWRQRAVADRWHRPRHQIGEPRDTDQVRMTYIPLAQIDPMVAAIPRPAADGAASRPPPKKTRIASPE